MAISSSQPIDFAAIAREMRATVALWYNAEIEIVDPSLREQMWDEFTNEYIGSSEDVIWTGSARVQPLSSVALLPDIDIMQGAIRKVRIQVPFDSSMPLIRKGLEIRVTNGGEDLILEDLVLVVRSAINSSYGWNRTIECDADVKSGLFSDGDGS
jgi:hypothetical protein